MIPKESWAGFGDDVPGNGRIDVPYYFYDQELGKWTRGVSPGFLEDRARTVIPESELDAIRAGTFVGEVFAATAISKIGYWSVSWPVLSNTVMHGTIVDTNGFLVSGATVEVSGLTYSGRSMAMVT